MDDATEAPGPLLTAAALDDEPTRGGSAWLREGARVMVFRAPRWEGLQARPLVVALLILAGYLLSLVVQRALMEGSPRLDWSGFLGGWAGVALSLWLCWIVARSVDMQDCPSPALLFALCCGAGLVFNLVFSAALLGLRLAQGPADAWPPSLQWAAWLLPVSWVGLAQIRLLWRVAGSGLARAAALLLVPGAVVLNTWLAPPVFWWPELPAEAETEAYAGLPLNDEIVSAQPELLGRALAALQPPQVGRVNLYGATYAPYASEDVFMRESAVVARTMRERFGAQGRLVELVVNPATGAKLPWATPLNLRRTITRIAAVMDRDRDVLFLHLTSHGGADGKLASDTAPLQTEPMTPELLKRWLDEAGVRWRVISVSACYSGSWIEPLAGDGTLVMTAADADHTSYGCGKRSELTFFGRAMYEEELRQTWSFTEAHAAARKVIEVREQEAGKSDGYSNPQISEGAGIRAVLKRLEAQQRGR
jgi:Peptidase C13 family